MHGFCAHILDTQTIHWQHIFDTPTQHKSRIYNVSDPTHWLEQSRFELLYLGYVTICGASIRKFDGSHSIIRHALPNQNQLHQSENRQSSSRYAIALKNPPFEWLVTSLVVNYQVGRCSIQVEQKSWKVTLGYFNDNIFHFS